MKKKVYFRSLLFNLECGHPTIEITSFYRLSKGRLNCLIGDFIRKGVFCWKCKTICQPTEFIKTERSK